MLLYAVFRLTSFSVVRPMRSESGSSKQIKMFYILSSDISSKVLRNQQ